MSIIALPLEGCMSSKLGPGVKVPDVPPLESDLERMDAMVRLNLTNLMRLPSRSRAGLCSARRRHGDQNRLERGSCARTAEWRL
jgi:hypothetical protein